MDLKEKAKAIRKQLKEQGVKASVRMSRGNAIWIDIKDLSADIDKVSEMARQYENIRRCEVTHEILAGGNDFVFVRYDNDTLRAERENYLDMAVKVVRAASPRQVIKIAVTGNSGFYYINDGANSLIQMNTTDRHHAWAHDAHNGYSTATALALIDHRFKPDWLI